MHDGLKTYAKSRGQNGMDIGKSVELFRRYAYLEQSCVRALAGWFLKVPDWEIKIQLGYRLFAHAERLDRLSLRLELLRGGRHRDANIEPRFACLGEELVNAPDEASFLAGLSWALQLLAGTYQEHLEAADRSANAPEARLLKWLVYDVGQEKEMVTLLEQNFPQTKHVPSWLEYLESLLGEAGGISGLQTAKCNAVVRPEHAPFEWPIGIKFDERIQHGDLGSYDSKMSLPLRERCIGEFQVYFNEFYAAALLATILYDSWKLDAPRQFFMDMAQHFWDEVRHAEFGAVRLRELGVEPCIVNMSLFEQARQMPLLHRLCYLTLGLEVYFMPRKSVRVRYYKEQGDSRSQLFADVDWSDESNHVRYGKQWVDYFLQEDARSVDDLQEEIAAYLESGAGTPSTGPKVPW